MENKQRQPKRLRRVGIYGGTFSPPHIGHIHAAKAFLTEKDLDELLIIPTFLPPHKERKDNASVKDRLSMCRLSFSFSEKIAVSDIEIQREGKSYTADTLAQLQTQDKELLFLCGTDMLLTMDTWHEPQRIFALAEIVCVRRENEPELADKLLQKAEEYRKSFGARISFLKAKALPLSSSFVRECLQKGRDTEGLLSDEVSAYIKERALYQ